MTKTLRCIVEGSGDSWDALCVDLDIAVSGHSVQEVKQSLEEAVADYLAYVVTLDEPDRTELLNRRAPWRLRIRFAYYGLLAALRGPGSDGQTHMPIWVTA